MAQAVDKRSVIGKFIHNSWISINMRCGKYKHLQQEEQKQRNKCYEGIIIEFSRKDYKDWCLTQKEYISTLNRPSLDRIDSTKNYSLDNIQIIELADNNKKKRPGSQYLNGPLSKTPRGVRKQGNRWTARITYKQKEKHIGSFNTKEEAEAAFKVEYYNLYGKYPF